MKNIAVIFEGSLYDRKGYLNAVLERTKHLKSSSEYVVDVYAIADYENCFIRLLRHSAKLEKYTIKHIEGFDVQMIWNSFSLIDYILSVKLKKDRFFKNIWLRRIAHLFSTYDLIIAHSYSPGLIALHAKQKYKIPYCVTWHGSDIHTAPTNNHALRQHTKDILDNSDANIFVSNALLNKAKEITSYTNSWTVLYNGVSNKFYEYSLKEKNLLKQQFKVSNSKVVAFVGNLLDIKNVFILPEIFHKVKIQFQSKITFWIIGDGKLRTPLQKKLDKYNLDYKIWGNQSVDVMPDFMNCIDVLVLPSKNEGLPLVTLEALKCGANVVGSDVGGIKEAIGTENVFDLGQQFSQNISQRIIKLLSQDIKQSINSDFSWERTYEEEIKIINNILNQYSRE